MSLVIPWSRLGQEHFLVWRDIYGSCSRPVVPWIYSVGFTSWGVQLPLINIHHVIMTSQNTNSHCRSYRPAPAEPLPARQGCHRIVFFQRAPCLSLAASSWAAAWHVSLRPPHTMIWSPDVIPCPIYIIKLHRLYLSSARPSHGCTLRDAEAACDADATGKEETKRWMECEKAGEVEDCKELFTDEDKRKEIKDEV